MLDPDAATPSPGSTAIEVRSQLDTLRRSHAASDVLNATKTLVTLAQNLAQHPADPKRHRVRIQNKVFFANVGRLQDACSIMEAMGFRRSADGDFFEAELGIGAGVDGGVPGAVATVLTRAIEELKADMLEEDLSRERMQHALAQRRKRKKEQDERWAQAWTIAGPRLGKGHWGGGLGGAQQKLPRHSSGFIGLSNQGATCYLNSLLQCLYHNALLRSALSQMTAEPQSSQSDGDSAVVLAKPTPATDSSKFLGSQMSSGGASHRGSIPDALRAVFHRLSFDKLTVDTKVLTDAFGWDSSDAATQQDAHETLLLLLDAVESRMTPAAARILNELITFQLEYRVTLDVNQPVEGQGSEDGLHVLDGIVASTTVESSRILSLDLVLEQRQRQHQQSVSGALGSLTAAEVLEGENAYFYDGSGTGSEAAAEATETALDVCAKGLQSRAYRHCKIVGSSLPPVLFANICRFTLDRAKNNSLLAVEPSLDLGPFLNSDAPAAVESADAVSGSTSMNTCCTYELSAVLVHAGTNAFGHYWSYVRARSRQNQDEEQADGQAPSNLQAADTGPESNAPTRGSASDGGLQDQSRSQLTWLAFNDATVSAVTEDEVLRTASGGEAGAGTTSAYMLVYVRSDCVADASARADDQAVDGSA
jgi:hypothetical protein